MSPSAEPLPTPVARPFFSAVTAFRSGEDSPRAFLDRCLESVDEFEPTVGAFVHMDVKAAEQAADLASRRWRDGKPLSPIDGMPVGIKDIIETADMPTQCGSPYFEGHRSGRDSASVMALRQAGAVILGKTVTTEFAGPSPLGDTRNPWDPRRTPGGSSSGSAAAVACGMVTAALGTQVIGSMVRPASYCGVVAFKGTVGSINRGGSHDGLSQSVHGPLAASLEDAWLVARTIADRVGGDPGYPGLFGPADPPDPAKPRKVAVLRTAGWPVADAGARRAFESAIERLASAGVEIATAESLPLVAEVEDAILSAGEVSLGIVGYETIWPLGAYRELDRSKLSKTASDRLDAAQAMTLDDYRTLLAQRERVRAVFAGLAPECDAALTLSATGPAPLGIEWTGDTVFNTPASLLGVPALNLPVLSVDGLPLGLQAIGFADRDSDLLGTGRWLIGALA